MSRSMISAEWNQNVDAQSYNDITNMDSDVPQNRGLNNEIKH